ncbi:MAG: GIY-YIG nuclease family protein [Alphaproteobacteria bacterium]|nr:GIY-YIG nuclease family protein [Alphaproteobacteria bacterium]
MPEGFFVYILTNKKHGTLYIGMTNNIGRRIYEHQNGLIEGFTKKYNLKKLIYYEHYETHDEAFTRERRLKDWNRDWKIKLIETNNPEWKDISTELY